MTDLGNRFSEGGQARPLPPRADGLDRLSRSVMEREPDTRAARGWLGVLKERSDLLAAVCAVAVAALIAWPHFHPADVRLPPVSETGEEMATIKVQPLWANGTAMAPDWYGLFNAYQLETSLRDISIRCNYGLPMDARVDRYLHAQLETGTEIRIFLADPGRCPKA